MEPTLTTALSIALGIGLAAATGLRIFLPLLIACIAARSGWITLNETFSWLDGTPALVMLATAAVVETLAYYVPGFDHMLDVIAGPAAAIAGVVASASVMTNVSPAVMWPLAIIAGGGIAGLTKGGTALIRAKTGVATAGFGNPVVSTVENVGAVGLAILAIVVPFLCLAVVLALLFWATRKIVRFFAGRRNQHVG